MTTAGQDRLFVPLTAEAFGWWLAGGKCWEVRREAPRWSAKHVRVGRRVELRRGYSGPSLWGTIIGIVRADDVVGLYACGVDLREIAPDPVSWHGVGEAIGGDGILVAFRVQLDPGQGVGVQP